MIGLWGIATYLNLLPSSFVPTPTQFVKSAIQLLTSGVLITESWISFFRVFVGFGAAALVGVFLGLSAGSFILFRQIVLPINSFLRYIPPTAFISLLIIYFGIGETYKYAVVFFGVVFFIVQMVIDVVDGIDRRQIEMAQTSEFSEFDIFKKVVIPSAMPRVFDVLRINLGAAWTFLVAAELIGSDSGLGHLIAISQRYLRLGDLFVAICAFGVMGLILDRTLDTFGRKWFEWYHVMLGR